LDNASILDIWPFHKIYVSICLIRVFIFKSSWLWGNKDLLPLNIGVLYIC
jgi:hypothetical protein